MSKRQYYYTPIFYELIRLGIYIYNTLKVLKIQLTSYAKSIQISVLIMGLTVSSALFPLGSCRVESL